MKKIKFATIAMAFTATMLGCNKEVSVITQNETKVLDPSKIYKTPTTPAEKQLVENLGKLTEIFKALYSDSTNLKLVNAAIVSKAYTDESVLLKDLIYPTQSRLTRVKKFKTLSQQWNLSLTIFAANFWKEVSRKQDLEFSKFLAGLNVPSTAVNIIANGDEANGEGGDVSIYFPYSDEFLPTEEELNGGGSYAPITTLVTATADADEGWGTLPYYVNGTFQYNTQVLVNDDYAAANPTHIIGVNGIEPYDLDDLPATSFQPAPPIDLATLTREIKQVYVGAVKIHDKQYDKLISFTGNGGGSEIVFTRSDAFLKVLDGQVLADNFNTPPKTISRKQIKKKHWVDFTYEWDGDWESNNLHQILAIYEEDNRNTSEISGKLSTTLKLLDLVTLSVDLVSWKVFFKSDDPIIRQIELNRSSFFELNRTNLEGQWYEGWPVRDVSGPVSWTLCDRTYY